MRQYDDKVRLYTPEQLPKLNMRLKKIILKMGHIPLVEGNLERVDMQTKQRKENLRSC